MYQPEKDKYGYYRTPEGRPVRETNWRWGPRGIGAAFPSENEVASALSLLVGMKMGGEITRVVRICLTEGKRKIMGS